MRSPGEASLAGGRFLPGIHASRGQNTPESLLTGNPTPARPTLPRAARSLLLLLVALGPVWSPSEPRAVAAQQSPTPTPLEAAYWDWLTGQLARQAAAVQALPSTLELGNA